MEKSKKVKAKYDAARGLMELFEDQLKDIFGAEKALTKAMPRMVDNASSIELIDALTEHFDFTNQQITRLEKVFESIGIKATAKRCLAMEGLVDEAEEVMKSTEEGVVRDAGIILAAQKIEHYEIATYGTLLSFANVLGEEEAASLLEDTLNEEKDADIKLTEIAETTINIEASGEM